MDTPDPVAALIRRTEERRAAAGRQLSAAHRAELGQFFTPSRAAALIAAMPRLPETGTIRVLDPGAGAGSLTAALVARVLRERPGLRAEVVAVEVDPAVAGWLEATLADCRQAAAGLGGSVTATAVIGDVLTGAAGSGRGSGPLREPFDLVIMNPPYRKLGARSRERQALRASGADCPNSYCAFLALGVMLLKPQGQLAAITPRSFANGPYFAAFRRFFLGRMTLDRLHVFESRSAVFADSGVLQENIIVSATRGAAAAGVVLSASQGHDDEAIARAVPYRCVLDPGDRNQFIHIPAGQDDARIAGVFAGLPGTLADLGLRAATGKVVDFRARAYLRAAPGPGCVPLIYPANLREGRVRWPIGTRKPQALADCPATRKLLLPAGRYVLVKRFSAKEERRRVAAFICDPAGFPAGQIAFENHLNVFHCEEQGLDENLARGLCLWLNSTLVDSYFRIFSGHTQVNATDLRSLRYPARRQLMSLGEALGQGDWPDQEKTDSLVALHVLAHEAGAGRR